MRRVIWLLVVFIAAASVSGQNAPNGQSDGNEPLTPQDRLDLANQRLAEREAAEKQSAAATPAGKTIFTGSESQLKHDEAIQLAKARYEVVLQRARIEYFKSVLAADDEFIGNLNAALAAAMQNQDLKAAEQLDAERATAVPSRELHVAMENNSPKAQIIHATWIVAADVGRWNEAVASRMHVNPGLGGYKPEPRLRAADVTNKLQEIIAKDDRGVHAAVSVFGDPQPYATKCLLIAVTIDGESKTISVGEGEPLPDILFPPNFPADDPAAIP
jgi:hypothetical protein